MARKETRSQERKRLLAEAASIRVPDHCDVIVVGGGAAGLVAAITAAEAGASVVVLERDLTCGRTILATGNGRCNFANVRLDPARYNDPDFVAAVCGPTWLGDVLSFFRTSGLRWCTEDDRLYPLSRSSASVRNVLLARATAAGVVLASGRTVENVTEKEGSDYPVEVACSVASGDEGTLTFPASRTVIMATGGEAFPLVENLGIRTASRRPVLCPLACEDSPLRALDGRRVHVHARHIKAGTDRPCWSEDGEVLFRDYGISGIVTFNLSRRAEAGDLIELDLVPDLLPSELRAIADPTSCGTFACGALDGVIDPLVAALLETLARKRWQVEWPGRAMPSSDTDALVSLAKSLPLKAVGPADTRQAQVIRGGFDTFQFDPATLATRTHPWLFACGEALDVDADCGGFNLAWAWKSGMVAGAAAARRARS